MTWNMESIRSSHSIAELNLTATGKGLMIAMGLLGLFATAGLLARINWRSRDFNP